MSRRHRRSSVLEAILDRMQILNSAAAWRVSVEADLLEAAHGVEAVAIVRERVLAADRKSRRRLYKLHDELARRQRYRKPSPLSGLMV